MMLCAKIATILSHLSRALVPDRSDFHARNLLIVNSMCCVTLKTFTPGMWPIVQLHYDDNLTTTTRMLRFVAEWCCISGHQESF